MNRLFLKYAALREELPRESYLNGLPAVRYLQRGGRLEFTTPITFFVGENGTGKSTLIEALAVGCGFNAEGGTRNFRFSTTATHSPLWQYLTLGKGCTAKDGYFLRAESFYNAASYLNDVYGTEFRRG
ncbi:MAG: AAA family ATPase, partial [Gemmiger sp.]